MTATRFAFEGFVLTPDDRRLCRDGVPVELNARYLDALALLVREAGRLVSKDRFLDEVWNGVPVTDEALTQCVRTLRRVLGDNAVSPRFIETVPKHGYRFIAAVAVLDENEDVAVPDAARPEERRLPTVARGQVLSAGGAGTLGAGVAGVIGGLFYGFAGGGSPLQPAMGTASVLLVLLCLTTLLALIGGAAVAFGIAASRRVGGGAWRVLGGATGGVVIGGLMEMLGLDAFNLLFGQSPGNITGGGEGALLGAAAGLGAWWVERAGASLRRGIAGAALAGAVAGTLASLLGGRLMGGSLDLLARQFPQSRLRLDQLGALLGEQGFGPISQAVTAGLEGALFAGCIVGAMVLARRRLG